MDSKHSTSSVSTQSDEALRQVPAQIGPRRLIAASIKRGTGQLVVKAVA